MRAVIGELQHPDRIMATGGACRQSLSTSIERVFRLRLSNSQTFSGPAPQMPNACGSRYRVAKS